MQSCLANAAPPGDPNAEIIFVFYCLLLMGAALVLGLIPFWIAWRRDAKLANHVRGVVIIWAVFAWGTAVYALRTAQDWAQTYNQRILSGAFDPDDPNTTQDAPREPWIAWAGVGIFYAAITVWAILGDKPEHQ